jgi:hypothetical protein
VTTRKEQWPGALTWWCEAAVEDRAVAAANWHWKLGGLCSQNSIYVNQQKSSFKLLAIQYFACLLRHPIRTFFLGLSIKVLLSAIAMAGSGLHRKHFCV